MTKTVTFEVGTDAGIQVEKAMTREELLGVIRGARDWRCARREEAFNAAGAAMLLLDEMEETGFVSLSNDLQDGATTHQCVYVPFHAGATVYAWHPSRYVAIALCYAMFVTGLTIKLLEPEVAPIEAAHITQWTTEKATERAAEAA